MSKIKFKLGLIMALGFAAMCANAEYTKVGVYKVDRCHGDGVANYDTVEDETFNLCDKKAIKFYDKLVKETPNFAKTKVLGKVYSTSDGSRVTHFVAIDPKTKTVNVFPYFTQTDIEKSANDTVMSFSKNSNEFCFNLKSRPSENGSSFVWAGLISAGGYARGADVLNCATLEKNGFSEVKETW